MAQPSPSLDRLKETLTGSDAFSLAALHVMTSLTGSALLALAVALGRMTPEEAWEAAHVDEDWQISQWGEDAEAAARRKNRWRDFEAAARLLRFVAGFVQMKSSCPDLIRASMPLRFSMLQRYWNGLPGQARQ